MPTFVDLPAELILNILTLLDPESQRFLRRVSRFFCDSVTSVLFKDIFFDFDAGGTDSLVAISKHSGLAKNVRTIVLQRRNSLRKLDDFRSWQQATVYEYEPFECEDKEIEWIEGVMSQTELDSMTNLTRRRLFNEYNNDYAAITWRTSQLACATSSSVSGHQTVRATPDTVKEVGQTIRNFSQAIKQLPNVTRFLHNPSYCFDDWGERWRNVQFHRSGLILQTVSRAGVGT